MTEATRSKILIADGEYSPSLPELRVTFPKLELVGVEGEQAPTALASGDFVGMVVQKATVDSALLDKLPNLQVLVKNGRNYNNVDVDAVRARNLTFRAIPRKGPNAVAEMAITFVLALSKDLLNSHRAVEAGAYRLRGLRPELSAERKIAFQWMKNALIHEVTGKTLGILGMGEIGCELARRADVMGMRVLYHKRTPLSPELEAHFHASYRSFEQLLAESDYFCVALPHTADTERLIGRAQLASMKPGSFLVNIARGGIIDEVALIEALQTQHLAGAGLDVFTYEPLQADSPLCQMHNVILTPHIGGGTGTTRTQELAVALQEVEALLAQVAAPAIP
jgi:lactate dehydrogenase-like 2-hydroxyacid dehydrogenase